MQSKNKTTEENEDEEMIKPQVLVKSQLICGDVAVSSTSSLKSCKKIMKELLEDKTITDYLTIHQIKKFSTPTGMG